MNNKPIFHITGEKGWINDPNGVVKFQGKYHVFYQYHPFSCVWGPMHWGHVVSEDLIHWTYLPIALTPGDEFDKDGCFSGSSLVVGDTLYVVYTGFTNNENPQDIIQIQCLASSKDGIHFQKHGAILTRKDLPSDYLLCDFRDPKLAFKDGYYLIFVAAKKVTGEGDILLFKSRDLFNWEFVNSVLSHKSNCEMIECVDYHEDLDLLFYSEVNTYNLNLSTCVYELGKLNEQGKFISRTDKKLIDYGFDFYAPQMMNDDHYLIGWMNMWDRSQPSAQYGFAGMLTVPRKVTVKNGRLIQEPVILKHKAEELEIDGEYHDHLSVGVVKLEVKELQELSINLRVGKDQITKFYLKNNEFYFDRSQSGQTITGSEKDEWSLKGIRKMPYVKQDEDIIYLILDKYSVEIFVNGVSMSNLIYPDENSDGLEIDIKAKSNRLFIYTDE